MTVTDEVVTFAVGDRVRVFDEVGTVQEVSERLRRARHPAVLVLMDISERAIWWYDDELAREEAT